VSDDEEMRDEKEENIRRIFGDDEDIVEDIVSNNDTRISIITQGSSKLYNYFIIFVFDGG
jgi:hypothetical protein